MIVGLRTRFQWRSSTCANLGHLVVMSCRLAARTGWWWSAARSNSVGHALRLRDKFGALDQQAVKHNGILGDAAQRRSEAHLVTSSKGRA